MRVKYIAETPLEAAALLLYEQGLWELQKGTTIPTTAQALLWENLREALKLPKGYATERGFHNEH